jgi:hypothetical protein
LFADAHGRTEQDQLLPVQGLPREALKYSALFLRRERGSAKEQQRHNDE